MNNSLEQKFKETQAIYTTTFQAIRNSPVYYLNSLPKDELQNFLSVMKEEVRQALSSIHWVEGMIKMKEAEE